MNWMASCSASARPDPTPTKPVATPGTPWLSVVIPVHNERDSIVALLDEVALVLRGTCHEIIVVDDASSDDTLACLQAARQRHPQLRLFAQQPRSGQSAALCAGTAAARADWIATLDGDGQNDPADIHVLWHARSQLDGDVRLVSGWRVQRADRLGKRLASRIANAVRTRWLGDRAPDSGCGIKLFERAAFERLPRFDHMHRYLPALFQRAGHGVASVPVNHRPRLAGKSKYGNWRRLCEGVVDLHGVTWLMRRTMDGTSKEL